jgi:hypothetical protein
LPVDTSFPYDQFGSKSVDIEHNGTALFEEVVKEVQLFQMLIS